MKRVVLCADDFGQDEAIDAGILRLVERGRLTAVSCLARGPAFASDAARLLPHGAAVDLGVHLDLTEGLGGAPAARLPWLVLRAYAGALDRREIARRLGAQLDAFERVAARPPDFVDGHQHVHQLPGIREALLGVLRRRYGPIPPYVRSTVPRHFRGAKALAVAALGGWALRDALVRQGVPHNRDFAGIYALDLRTAYGDLMKRWLDRIEDGGLLICHPGLPGGAPGDPIAPARAAEFRYLESEAFAAALAAARAVPSRFTATGAPRSAIE